MKLASSVKGSLVLSAFGALFFLASVPLANWTGLAFLAVAGVTSLLASGWLLILHTIGLLLSVGHRLSLTRRAALYYPLALASALAVAWLTHAPWRVAGPSLAMVLALTSALVYLDFSRFPPAAAAGMYSPLDAAIARLVNRCLSGRT